jgi:hypothetical protein
MLETSAAKRENKFEAAEQTLAIVPYSIDRWQPLYGTSAVHYSRPADGRLLNENATLIGIALHRNAVPSLPQIPGLQKTMKTVKSQQSTSRP